MIHISGIENKRELRFVVVMSANPLFCNINLSPCPSSGLHPMGSLPINPHQDQTL